MSSGLNLLPSSAKFQAERTRWRKVVKIYLWSLGAGWLLLSVGIFGSWWLGKLGVEAAEKKYNKMLANYKALASEARVNEKLKYETKKVGEMLGERFEYGKTIKKIDELFPSQKVTIEDFQLKDRTKFMVKGTVTDGPDVDDLERRLAEINGGISDFFSKAKLLSLEVSGNVWTFSLEVEIK